MGIKKYIFIFFPYFLFAQNNNLVSPIKHVFSHYSSRNLSIDTISQNQDVFDYHIALLLPFCVDSNQSILSLNLDSINENYQPELFKKSLISIDFFNGFLMALNNLEYLNFKISVFDIAHDNKSEVILDQIINSRSLRGVDLIVGPLFTDNFVYFTDNFKKKKVPIIAPFSKKQHIVNNHSNVILIQPSIENQLKTFSNYIFDNHSSDNILLIRRDTLFKKNLKKIVPDSSSIIIDTIIPKDIYLSNNLLHDVDTTIIKFKEIKINTNVVDSIYHELDTLGSRNVIIIPSEDNVFVTDLLSKLHACRDTGMIVYGMQNLYNYDHLNFTDLTDMNLSFPYHKMDNSQIISQFVIAFHNQYQYIPNLRYSVVGYEIATYFSQLLSQSDLILPILSNIKSSKVLENIFDFYQIDDNGFINEGVVILRYDSFGYKKIN